MSKKKEIKKTTSNITPRVEKRIIELHQKNKLGAQAIADKLSEEFTIKFSRAPIGKRLTQLKKEGKIKTIPYFFMSHFKFTGFKWVIFYYLDYNLIKKFF